MGPLAGAATVSPYWFGRIPLIPMLCETPCRFITVSFRCCGAFDLNKNQPTTAWFVVSYSVSFLVGYESMSIPNHHVISLLTSQHDHSVWSLPRSLRITWSWPCWCWAAGTCCRCHASTRNVECRHPPKMGHDWTQKWRVFPIENPKMTFFRIFQSQSFGVGCLSFGGGNQAKCWFCCQQKRRFTNRLHGMIPNWLQQWCFSSVVTNHQRGKDSAILASPTYYWISHKGG